MRSLSQADVFGFLCAQMQMLWVIEDRGQVPDLYMRRLRSCSMLLSKGFVLTPTAMFINDEQWLSATVTDY